jgi:hypothetical protein
MVRPNRLHGNGDIVRVRFRVRFRTRASSNRKTNCNTNHNITIILSLILTLTLTLTITLTLILTLTTGDGAEAGQETNIEKYFNQQYKKYLPGGMKYPMLPTVGFNGKKAEYVPAELVSVPGGQTRAKKANSSENVSKLIRMAAVPPNIRQRYLTNGDGEGNPSIVSSIRNDMTARSFGVSDITQEAIICHASVLPPALLQYGSGNKLDPKLEGSWNTPRQGLFKPAQVTLSLFIHA